LADAGIAASVAEVFDDKKRGLTARLQRSGPVDEASLGHLLGQFTIAWEWQA
jgi:fatty-acyl-CoA synthase